MLFQAQPLYIQGKQGGTIQITDKSLKKVNFEADNALSFVFLPVAQLTGIGVSGEGKKSKTQ